MIRRLHALSPPPLQDWLDDALHGKSSTFAYVYEPAHRYAERLRLRLRQPGAWKDVYTKGFFEDIGVACRSEQIDGVWWARIVPSAPNLDRLLNGCRDLGIDASPVERFGLLWALDSSGVGKGASTSTAAPEGRFEVLRSGLIKLYLPRKWELPHTPEASLLHLRREDVVGEKWPRWYWLFKASRAANIVAPMLRPAYPGMARVFSAPEFVKIAEPYDTRECGDPIRELAHAPGPSALTHPINIALAADIMDALSKRLPAGCTPSPYQIIGAEFAIANGGRALIADEMGLGKTVEAICVLVARPEEYLPAVIVVPAIVFKQWPRELAKWAPTIPVYSMPKGNSPPPPAGFRGVILTKYDLVGKQHDALRSITPQTLILDESHRIKNPEAQRTQHVAALGLDVPHVILLSGTPFRKNVMDFWMPLQLIATERFGSMSKFKDKYVVTREKYIGGGKYVQEVVDSEVNDEEGMRHRLECVMIRRSKADVGEQLPPFTRVTVDVDVDTKFAKDYAQMESILANRPPMAEAARLFHEMRLLLARAKFDTLLDLIDTLREQKNQVIVFAWHRPIVAELLEALAEAKVPHACIVGGASQKQKDDAQTAFLAGKIDVIVGSTAMCEGINLQSASHVVFLEQFWTAADQEQAESRAHRRGQQADKVTAYFLEVPDTIDQRIARVVRNRRAAAAAVLGGGMHVGQEDTSAEALISSIVEEIAAARGTPPAAKKPRAKKGTAEAKKNPSEAIDRRSIVSVVFPRGWAGTEVRHWMAASGLACRGVRTVRGLVVADVREPRGWTQAVTLDRGIQIVVEA